MTATAETSSTTPARSTTLAPSPTPPGDSATVRIENLAKRFGDTSALVDVNLSVGANEFVSIVGPSGCGKSTLLAIIAGLEDATEGSVTLDHEPVTGPGRDRGVIFQQATLLPWLTALGNVEFALRPDGLRRRERLDVAREHLGLVGLSGFEEHYPAQLSGGMQQRVALARSLSYRPRMLLMDEPFGALDALTRRTMQHLLADIWETHRMTVVLVTHDIEEAVYTSDRVVVMSGRPGRCRAEIPIPLPRPRHPDLLGDAEFRGYFTQILELIHTASS